jgi:integrase/recombinase XerD
MRQQIEAFLRHSSTEKKFSSNTVAAYKNDLFQMADFFQEKGTQRWSDVDHDLVLGYVTDLKSRGYALTTVARKTASAKTLFKFLEKSGAIPIAPIENVGSPRVLKNTPQRLPDGLIRDLLRQPDKYPTPEAKRDKAMLELLYASGMRISDMMSLNVDDVNLDGDSVSFAIRGSKARNATVSLRHVPTLRKYLDESRPQLVHHKAERALFLNRLGQRLTRQGLWQIMKTYAKQAKLGGEVTLRALRHSFAANTPKAKA